jgi:hypothetical protein
MATRKKPRSITARQLFASRAEEASTHEFMPIGAFGVECAVEGNELILRVPINENLEEGHTTSTGKNVLVANTGGWVPIPGTDPAMRINVMAIVPPQGRAG